MHDDQGRFAPLRKPLLGDAAQADQAFRDWIRAERGGTDWMLRVGIEGVNAGRCNEEMKRMDTPRSRACAAAAEVIAS